MIKDFIGSKRHYVVLFLVFTGLLQLSTKVSAQKVACDFISPVMHHIISSGSYGEPRSAHFHSGIDIKPHKGAGKDEILAVEDGYVSRIRITPDSYGRVIYIDHPCGYTSVYAHLNRFNKTLDEYIDKVRIATKKSEIDQYPPPNALQVKKGETIGYLGNSGGSFGAHLHFEIRQTISETPINPVLFDIGPKDNIAPVIRGLVLYKLDAKRHVISKDYYPAIKTSNGHYTLKENTVRSDWPLVGLGLHVYDQSNGAGNHNGIYSIDHMVNGQNTFSFKLDSVPFHHSIFLHAHMDFEYKKNNLYVHKCYTEPQSALDIYDSPKGGLLLLNELIDDHISIVTKDVYGNASTLAFSIIHQPNIELSTISHEVSTRIMAADSSFIKKGRFYMDIPPGAVLHNTSIRIDSIKNGIDIKTKEQTPFFKKYALSYRFNNAKEEKECAQCIFVTIDSKGRKVNIGGEIKDHTLTTRHNQLEKIFIEKDTIPPTIQVISVNKLKPLKFVMKDNYKAGGKKMRIKYDAYLNDQWTPLDYDLKNDAFTTNGPLNISPGSTFRIEIKDYSGNSKTYSKKL